MSTTRRILKNFVSLSFSQIVTKALGLVSVAYLARVLGAEGFGKIGFAQAILAYFMLLVNLGLSTLGTREVARNREEISRYVNNILTDDTIRDLKKAEVLRDDDEILVKDILTLSPAYVIYTFNHHENVTQIHEFLEQNDIYSCGRFGEWEYLNMDGAILSGKKVVEKLVGKHWRNCGA